MNKIDESIDTIYITGFNFINHLYGYRAIFPYAFLPCQKCISKNSLLLFLNFRKYICLSPKTKKGFDYEEIK